MGYVIGGSNGESSAFEKTIANEAIMVLHEYEGIVDLTDVVTPTQGTTYRVPQLGPITFGDFTDSTGDGMTLLSQNPGLDSASITATPALAQTTFSSFFDEVAAFNVATGLGQEIGQAFNEKRDQRVCAAFNNFNSSVTDTLYTVGSYGDGYDRIKEVGAVQLVTGNVTVASSAANSVVGLVNLIIKKWRLSRNPGRPVIILRPEEQSRLLSELTNTAIVGTSGGTVGALSAAGQELQATGSITNLNGATLKFTTFLGTAANVSVQGGSATSTVHVGAAFGPRALTTVQVAGLDIKLREMPNPAYYSLTGTGFFGTDVSSKARGMAIQIA